MDAFQKAKRRVESFIAEFGTPPRDIVITRYASEAAFLRHHPVESYEAHLRQRAALVEWLTQRGIDVKDYDVAGGEEFPPASPPDLAEKGARRRTGFLRHGDPYRLGLSIGAYPGQPQTNALGWMVLWLGGSRKGED
ncbi:hypothetical protein [Hypericibacter sp.]|uniref:hypothetical protein n=1 Tax=Hypericibacter sp. TaxID=2705401 RepID=UPI003D6D565C